MTWVKIDDGFADHPKIDALSDAAYRMYVNGLCYCAQQLTDGAIPDARVDRLLPNRRPKARAELIASGLWTATDTGVEIHDYLTYQPARSQVLAEREATAERQRRWRESRTTNAVRNGVTDSVSDAVSHAAPTRPDPTPYSSSSSNGSSNAAPGALDDEDLWRQIAQLRAQREPVPPSPKWLTTTAANAKAEMANQAADLRSRYVLTPSELAQVLDAGPTNSQILRYAQRKEPA